MHPTPCPERQVTVSSIAKTLGLPVEGIETWKSFTELGGHSLSAVEVQNDCKPLVQKPPTVLSLLVSPFLKMSCLPKPHAESIPRRVNRDR
ncbi:hypothetical protein BKA81DRAFT_100175 [Phyllosticta paracitricarpa]